MKKIPEVKEGTETTRTLLHPRGIKESTLQLLLYRYNKFNTYLI